MVHPESNNFLFNDEVNQNLENVLNTELFSNGYIFYGPEGVGKKQTALKFIKGIFSKYSSNSKIEEKIIKNNHPDLLYIEPTHLAKGNLLKNSDSDFPKKKQGGVIRIEQIRYIKTFLGRQSIESGKKIVLIVDSHLLNEAASNCLLKTLEEPSNGIFILITSKKNLLLETIISRCQLVRFKTFSIKELEIYLEKNLDSSMFENYKNLNLRDLINAANGSPEKVLNNIKIWSELSHEITDKLDFPIKNNLEILKISKLISEKLDVYQQVFLINFIQILWWKNTRNEKIIKKLDDLKFYINNLIQPRLAWEVILLKIALEDLL